MGLKKAFFIGVFLIALGSGHAQIDSTAIDSSQSNEYVQKFPDKVALKVSFVNSPNNFFYTNTESSTHYRITPNKKERISLGVQFRAIEFGLGFSPDFLPGNDPDSDSEIYNLNFRGFYKGWICTLSFYHQRGFDITYNNTREEAPHFETNKIGGSIGYSLNKNFSYRASVSQREWQRKSAGSFLPRIYWYYTNFVMESSGFDDNNKAFDIAIAPSYHYNFVMSEHFLISVGASAGIGLDYNDFGNQTSINPLYEASFNGAVSFNYKRFFYGLQANVLFIKQKLNQTMRLNDEITYVNLYFGYRFPAPKALSKTADKINEKLNLPQE